MHMVKWKHVPNYWYRHSWVHPKAKVTNCTLQWRVLCRELQSAVVLKQNQPGNLRSGFSRQFARKVGVVAEYRLCVAQLCVKLGLFKFLCQTYTILSRITYGLVINHIQVSIDYWPALSWLVTVGWSVILASYQSPRTTNVQYSSSCCKGASAWSFAYRGIKHGDFCCFKGVTYVALTLCFKLRSFLHWYQLTAILPKTSPSRPRPKHEDTGTALPRWLIWINN